MLHFVNADSIRFAYLEAGSGPLVLLLHGYPDDAHSWEHQMPVLADAGYRVVAPFLRGYPPTEVPANGFCDRATLASDIKALICGEPLELTRACNATDAARRYGTDEIPRSPDRVVSRRLPIHSTPFVRPGPALGHVPDNSSRSRA